MCSCRSRNACRTASSTRASCPGSSVSVAGRTVTDRTVSTSVCRTLYVVPVAPSPSFSSTSYLPAMGWLRRSDGRSMALSSRTAEGQDLCQAANEKRLRQQGARCRSTHTAAPRRSLAICSLAPLRRSTRPTPRASPTGTCAPSWLRTPLTAASRRLRGRSRREGRRLSRPPGGELNAELVHLRGEAANSLREIVDGPVEGADGIAERLQILGLRGRLPGRWVEAVDDHRRHRTEHEGDDRESQDQRKIVQCARHRLAFLPVSPPTPRARWRRAQASDRRGTP